MSSFSELIKLGSWAKGMGQYDAANAAFGLALEQWFRDPRGSLDKGVRLYIESQDEAGQIVSEVYYDLLTIEDEGEKSLCIPIPLLSPFAAFCAAKTASLVEKRDHNGRKIRDDVADAEIEELWRQLLDLGEERDWAEVFGEILNLD